ncbi:MAG TPA: transglycosylase domain-containing protein, partial [Ignavibacteriaceae bacterium]|nr:transglycosylase domain-containing protein [Ignavibacteriaceae bacterium]
MNFDKHFHFMFLKYFPAVIIVFLFSCDVVFSQDLPPINLQYSSYAVTSDGHIIGFYGDKNRVDARSTGYISKYVIWSLIATEDRDFYNHNGVSIKGIIRGIFKTLTGHIQGGSTLTMQLARNLFLTDERTISRKIKEIELARKLEEKYTKDEILLMYLNTVYFGRGAYGIWAAAEEYFDKTPDQLSITESAALVGMVQSPGGYDPVNHPGRMWARRNIVLHNLVETNKLSENEYEQLIKTPLGLNLNDKFGKFFLEDVRKDADKILTQKGLSLNRDELKITTTLNYNMQKAAEDAVALQWRNFPKSMQEAQIGLISVEPGTGMIRAMIGGNPNSSPGGLNRSVQILRQPGSSFKPFLYGSLLEKGYTLAEPLSDSPIIVDSGTSFEWRPENDDNSFSDKPVSMEYAIQNSINLSAAYAITHLTSPDSVVAFAHRLGIQSDIPSLPSIALGTGEVSPLDMASAMAVFGDEGLYAKPFTILKIEDKNGRIIYDKEGIDTSTVLDSATAYLTTTALESVVNGGTASS